MSRGNSMSSGTGIGPHGLAVREPSVAGAFYPADPTVLARTVDGLLDAVDLPADDRLAAGYVVPHAGYRYSGATAAQVYARLRRHADRVERVLLLGPAHRVPLRGCAVPTTERWLTPLGEVDVDAGTMAIVDAGYARADDTPHIPEHSLEVQIPFLQRALSGVRVIPVVVGGSAWSDVAAMIAGVGGGPGTVVVCSTDLSHYLPDAAARRQDARTAAAIEGLDPDGIGTRDACGVYALRGTVAWARDRGLAASRLALTTSADSPDGDPARVVGYPAFAFG